MIKIVYVFTGTEKPEYLNMLRISVASVRKQMPAVEIEILTDTATGDYLLSHRVFEKDSLTVVPAAVPEGYTIAEQSRYLKTNLRKFIAGDFLYIDTDTIVCADLSRTEPDASVSLVADAHGLLSEQENGGAVLRRAAAERGIDLSACTHYYNGGVILAKDDERAHEFFRRWYEMWESTRRPGMHHDQYSLNAVNGEMNLIKELDGTWNCQITANDRAFYYLRNVKILHYLSAQPYGIYRLNDIGLLRRDLTADEIEKIIAEPEKQFCPFHFYADDSIEYRIIQGSHFHLIHRIFTRHRKLYDFGERLLSKLRK